MVLLGMVSTTLFSLCILWKRIGIGFLLRLGLENENEEGVLVLIHFIFPANPAHSSETCTRNSHALALLCAITPTLEEQEHLSF